MSCEGLAAAVRIRINELKSEQVLLKPFILSDQVLHEALEKAIVELSWVLQKIEAGN